MCPVVLLVEDNPTFRKSMKEMLGLRFPGIKIDEAPDGEQALQKLTNISPDGIFMEIKLPARNGLEATRQSKRLITTRRWSSSPSMRSQNTGRPL
jgi:CheY-like chemotaxis protein